MIDEELFRNNLKIMIDWWIRYRFKLKLSFNTEIINFEQNIFIAYQISLVYNF